MSSNNESPAAGLRIAQQERNGHDIGFLLETLEKYADDLNDLDVKAESLTDLWRRGIAIPALMHNRFHRPLLKRPWLMLKFL
jgi:hypothetical protein